MSTYTDNGSAVSIGVQGYASHADSAGLDYRLRIMAHREARGQYLRIMEEIDAGIEATQTMSRRELQSRLDEARGAAICKPLYDWETGIDVRKLRSRAA